MLFHALYCLWGHALKRSPGINHKSRVLYPGPGFLSSATWPSLLNKHYNRLTMINQAKYFILKKMCGKLLLSFKCTKQKGITYAFNWINKNLHLKYFWKSKDNGGLLLQSLKVHSDWACQHQHNSVRKWVPLFKIQRIHSDTSWVRMNSIHVFTCTRYIW